ALSKPYHPAHHVKNDRDHVGKKASQHKTHRGIALREGGDKVRSGEESSCVYHSYNTADDQHNDRKYKVDDPSLALHDFLFRICVGPVRRSIYISLDRVILVKPHGT